MAVLKIPFSFSGEFTLSIQCLVSAFITLLLLKMSPISPLPGTHLVFGAVMVVGVAAVVLNLVVECLPGGQQVSL